MNNDLDRVARNKIENETERNFFIEAGAGSGKTTELVQRMVSMIINGTDIRHICAITFTKAAAREFYSRFQSKLSKTIAESDDETVRARCREALKNIDLCFMGTIDSFSELILREHPLEAGIPSDFTVCPSSDMKSVYRREYSEIIRGNYGKELLKKYDLFRKVCNSPEKAFMTGIEKMAELRCNDIVYDAPVTDDLDEILEPYKAAIMNIFECIYANTGVVYMQGKTTKEPDRFLRILTEFKPYYEMLKQPWGKLFSKLPDILKKMKNFKITCAPEEIGIRAVGMFEGKGKSYTLKIEDNFSNVVPKEIKYSAAMDFIVSLLNAVSEHLKQKGELTFFEAKLCLRDMLKKDAENGGKLIKHIAERHHCFLIDEFQDTDPMQSEIFFYLAAKEPVPDWRKCVPRDGSLFIVGDPKQSIYRFRNADIGAYSKVKKLFEDSAGEVLGLTRNFRSTVKMKTWFNDVFSRLLPENTMNQSKFEPIPIEGEDDPGLFSGVYRYLSNGDGDAKKVRDIINKLVGSQKYMVGDADRKCLRSPEYRDFMIITNKKDQINEIMSVLGEADIPCYVEGTTLFSQCPSLITMTALLKAAAYPDDSISVYSALKSDIFGITDDELAEALPSLSLFKEYEGDGLIAEALDTLKKISYMARTMTVSALFSYVLDDMKLLSFSDSDELECLYYALELIRSAEAKGEIISVQDGADMLDDLIKKAGKERCLSFDKSENTVHIANLHKVKGLEANIVILAGKKGIREIAPSQSTVYGDDSIKSYIFDCKDDYSFFNTLKYSEQKETEKMAENAEFKRLLYVAATRAKAVLIAPDRRDENGEKTKDNPWGYIADNAQGSIFDDLPAEYKNDRIERETVFADDLYASENAFEKSDADAATYTIIRPSQIKVKTRIQSEDDYEDGTGDEVRKKEIRTDAALVGTMVHKLMECIVSAKIKPDKDMLIKNIINDMDVTDDYSKLLEGVYDRIYNGGYRQKTGFEADILSLLKDAEEVHCEIPFSYKDDEENGTFALWHGIIDLLYKKDGKWHIVDYKTNAEINDLKDKYREQLGAYVKAVQKLTGETADAAIYHIEV